MFSDLTPQILILLTNLANFEKGKYSIFWYVGSCLSSQEDLEKSYNSRKRVEKKSSVVTRIERASTFARVPS